MYLAVVGMVPLLTILALVPHESYGDDDEKYKYGRAVRPKDRAHVLVLGDIGRSPRMQNQALSIARCDVDVDLIGYVESEIHSSILEHPQITIHNIFKTPKVLQTGNPALFLLLAPIKVLYQMWSLWIILGSSTKPARWLLVQNPPSIPTLFIVSWMCWLRNTKLAIDWHNFGYSVLGLKLGSRHPMVIASYIYEKWFSKAAHVNFTVSEAMSRQLQRDFRVKAPVIRIYDRPNADFKPIDKEERRKFLLGMDLPAETKIAIEKDELKVIVSSTSWTPDEDFSMLLDALTSYSTAATGSGSKLPDLLVVITGKGPQQEHYLKKVAALESSGKLKKVMIQTAWLSTSDYARLLASADLGVSLHRSSSGVDLPMKVVDMFGAGLPVAGYSAFESWPEQIKEGENGRGFITSEELQAIIAQLLSDGGTKLARLREGVLKESIHSWDEEWTTTVGKAMGYKGA